MKALMIVVPILLVGGALGAAFMGVINIPGVTPKKATAKANAMYGEGAEPPAASEDSASPEALGDLQTPIDAGASSQAGGVDQKPAASVPDPDIELGCIALAKYWDEIELAKLLPITEAFSDAELGQVLIYMKKAKVAELLGKVPPDRAAKLSRELLRLSSVAKESAS